MKRINPLLIPWDRIQWGREQDIILKPTGVEDMRSLEREIVSLNGSHFVFLTILLTALASGYSLGRIVQAQEDVSQAIKAERVVNNVKPAPYTPSNCLWLDDKASP